MMIMMMMMILMMMMMMMMMIDGAIVSRSELVVTFGSPNRGRSAATRRLATARHRTQHDLDLSHHARLESQPRGGKETELQPAPASELSDSPEGLSSCTQGLRRRPKAMRPAKDLVW